VSARPSLFSELQRRNVLRAGALYAGAVWAFGQGLSQFSPAVGLPDRATRWFLIAAAIGFPFWIAFAWFYEFTPQGLKKRESEIAPDDSIAHSTRRRLDKWIIAVLVVAVVLLLTNTFVWRNGAGLASDSALASPPAKSIAVLPFEDLSPGHDHGYFSAGMAEELLNALARVQDLKVAGRASSFYYGGDPTLQHVDDFGYRMCEVPAVVGGFLVEAAQSGHAIVSLDVSNPEHPRELSRILLWSDEYPHWLALEPGWDRLVITGYGALDSEARFATIKFG